jgi:hypothetical protein
MGIFEAIIPASVVQLIPESVTAMLRPSDGA